MTIDEAIKILAEKDQHKYKNINLTKEYKELVKQGTSEYEKQVIKEAHNIIKQERKEKLKIINENK